ncbi:BTAD domain-containing putative transcriptional regulator [Actinomadura madurae]|uniref:BTAD domain-containing putative transcriptional regulator n=1 Tax=Actinomadura madurae TaxID=1993 RepID=UPI0020D20C78|nr:BTAD domain-containing putative transcriptional regulator [Actinomadura madurae]MCQ0009599.1 tetratricopeptide repeat protein [Actinomadura madurae]
MRFGVLGPLEARTEDGRPVRVADRKVRALLAGLLARAGRVVPADRLIEDLWGSALPADPMATLRARVSQLRRTLEDAEPHARALIEARSPGYRLAARTDARLFEDLAGRAASAPDPGTRAGLLADALALWRGPAYADFADAPFAVAEIARLDELRLAAVEEHAEARLELGGDASLVAGLRGLVAEHPLRERLRAAYMRALYRSGRPADALAAYDDLRVRLRDELGLDPGPELSGLHAAMLRHDPAVTGARRDLPADVTALVGREAAVREVTALLDASRLVTLHGTGGVGKTRLAVAVARGARAPGGVRMVRLDEGLGAGASAGEVASFVAGALGLRDDARLRRGPGRETRGRPARRADAARPRQLRARGRAGGAAGGGAAAGRPGPARPRHEPGTAGDQGRASLDRPSAGRRCGRHAVRPAGGHRAGLRARRGDRGRLRAARLRPAGAGARGHPGAGARGGRAGGAAGRPVPAAVVRCPRRPGPAADAPRAGRLELGAPGRARARRPAAAGDPRGRMHAGGRRAGLRRRSRRAREPRRPVARRRGRGALPAARIGGRVLRRTAPRGGGVRRRAAPPCRVLHRPGGARRPARTRPAGRAPAAARGDREPAGRARRRRPGRRRRSRAAAGERDGLGLVPVGTPRRGAPGLRAGARRPGRDRQGRARTWHTGFTMLDGDAADRDARVREALASDDDPWARWFLGFVRAGFGDLEAIGELATRALEGFRAAGDVWGEAAALATRAAQALSAGDLNRAGRDGEQALELFRKTGDRWGHLQATETLGLLAEVTGDYARARELHESGLRDAEELGLWTEVSGRLSRLGRIALLEGDLDAADDLHERGRRLAIRESHRRMENFADIGLALAARRSGRLDEAETILRRWLAWCRDIDGGPGLAFLLAELGFIAELRGDAKQALSLHEEGLAAARATGNPRAIALAHEGLAGALSLAGDHEGAAAALAAAAEAREAAGAPLPAAERGDVERISARLAG